MKRRRPQGYHGHFHHDETAATCKSGHSCGNKTGTGTGRHGHGKAESEARLRVAEVAGGVQLPHLSKISPLSACQSSQECTNFRLPKVSSDLVGVDVVAAALVRAGVGLQVAVVQTTPLACATKPQTTVKTHPTDAC